jgi:hypothetical protein
MSYPLYLFLYITVMPACMAAVVRTFLKINNHGKQGGKRKAAPIAVRRKFAVYDYEEVFSVVRRDIIKNKFGRSSLKRYTRH